MPEPVKGLPDLYDDVCKALVDAPFIEWLLEPSDGLTAGQLCSAVVWYAKRKKWYLEAKDYDPVAEEASTWRAIELRGNYPDPEGQFVMRHFDLAKGERLITTNSKIRPVVLLRRSVSDWWNPDNTMEHVESWLCLPLFTYKHRHNQAFVLRDQCLEHADRFYIPSFYGSSPGPHHESAARFQAIQMINVEHLTPLKHPCNAKPPPMARPFRLSPLGLRLMLYHFYTSLGCFHDLEEPGTEYALFKEQVGTMLAAAGFSE